MLCSNCSVESKWSNGERQGINSINMSTCVENELVYMVIIVLVFIFQIRDAKKLYKELYKSAFPFEHCWKELRSHSKWMEECQTKKQKTGSTATPGSSCPSTPDSINLEDENENYVDLERPQGRKAEKDQLKKQKSKDRENESTNSPLVKLFEEIKEERKAMNEKKMEMFERTYLQEQQKNSNGTIERGRENNVN